MEFERYIWKYFDAYKDSVITLYRFPNGYGLSVVSYSDPDKSELSGIRVVKYKNEFDWTLCQDEKLENFPHRQVNVETVEYWLRKVKELARDWLS